MLMFLYAFGVDRILDPLPPEHSSPPVRQLLYAFGVVTAS